MGGGMDRGSQVRTSWALAQSLSKWPDLTGKWPESDAFYWTFATCRSNKGGGGNCSLFPLPLLRILVSFFPALVCKEGGKKIWLSTRANVRCRGRYSTSTVPAPLEGSAASGHFQHPPCCQFGLSVCCCVVLCCDVDNL